MRIHLSFLEIETSGESGGSAVILPGLYQDPDILIPLAKSNTFHQTNFIIDYPAYDIEGAPINHSLDFRAQLVSAFIDSMEIRNVTVIGEGYGGLVGMDLISSGSDPDAFILISSLGVEEFLLLGNHTFNTSVFTILQPLSAFLNYAIPHFGYFNYLPLSESYIKSLQELDQRPIRDQLAKIDLPVLILHSEENKYIPLAVSEETYRLLPQSELHIMSGNRTTLMRTPQEYMQTIADFLSDDTIGRTKIRASASEERKRFSEQRYDPESISSPRNFILITIFLFLFLFTVVSEDLACISGGLLAASGLISFWVAVWACFTGILFFNTVIFLIGKRLGFSILQKPPVKWLIKEKDVLRAERMFQMHGIEILFITRFIPGTRLPVYLSAGLLKIGSTFFLFFFFLSLVIYTPALVWISSVIGQPIINMVEVYQDYVLWIFAGAALVIYLFLNLAVPLFTARGRRVLIYRLEKFRRKFSK